MVSPTCFGITLPSSRSVLSAFWEILNRGTLLEDGNVMPKHVADTIHTRNSLTESIIVAFVGFSHIFMLGILIFKWHTARRLYKSFGVKGLISRPAICIPHVHDFPSSFFMNVWMYTDGSILGHSKLINFHWTLHPTAETHKSFCAMVKVFLSP
jgi:hypothetical protein